MKNHVNNRRTHVLVERFLKYRLCFHFYPNYPKKKKMLSSVANIVRVTPSITEPIYKDTKESRRPSSVSKSLLLACRRHILWINSARSIHYAIF